MKVRFVSQAMTLVASLQILRGGQLSGKAAELEISDFVDRDRTEVVFRHLGAAIFVRGLLGVTEASGDPQTVFVDGHGRTVAGILDEICTQDPRYRWSEWKDSRMINIISGDAHSLAQQILDTRISAVDVEADDMAENIIRDLVDYSPSLRDHLQALWKVSGGGSSMDAPFLSGMTSDKKISHFSLHLRDVTVREALNAVSLHSQDMYEASGIDPRVVGPPSQPLERPAGWYLHVPDPKTLAFVMWCHRIFEPLL